MVSKRGDQGPPTDPPSVPGGWLNISYRYASTYSSCIRRFCFYMLLQECTPGVCFHHIYTTLPFDKFQVKLPKT